MFSYLLDVTSPHMGCDLRLSENGSGTQIITMHFGGDWIPQSSSENMTGFLGRIISGQI